MRFPRSLAMRLSLVLLVLLLALGALTLISQLRAFNLYQAEINQRMNRNLPMKIIASQGWEGQGVPTMGESEPLFHDLMMLNPWIELYILDLEGNVVGFSAEKPLVRDRVEVGPILSWLDGTGQLPILGDDPRGSGEKVFVANPLVDEAQGGTTVGYLYIVLPSELHDSVRKLVEGSYILRMGVGRTLFAVTAALTLGLILFYLLTGRLRSLSRGMDAFRERGEVPASLRRGADPDGDELDRLTTSFVSLADRVSHQIDELIEADAKRRELVAGISHDLRTPLTILRGYLETLQVKEASLTPEDRKRSLDAALRQAEHLSDLVSQLFELATLDGDAVQVEKESFSVADLVQDVAQKYRVHAEEQGVQLTTHCGAGLPLVHGDLRLIERALDNLLENALRHTPHGGSVSIRCQNGGERVRVEVTDDGEGIAEAELSRIFDPFYRPSNGRKTGTAGLGLTIVRRVLELHGSTIEVESAEGRGASFSFRLPAG